MQVERLMPIGNKELKNNIRASAKSFVLGLSAESKKIRDQKITQRLVEFLEKDFRGKSLGVYRPLSDEVDWGREPFLVHGAVPIVKGEVMNYQSAEGDEVFPSVIVVPGLVFSRTGFRVGRGGGHFDRYLAKNTCTAIGVCYGENTLEEFPHDEWDKKVNYIINEDEVIGVENGS